MAWRRERGIVCTCSAHDGHTLQTRRLVVRTMRERDVPSIAATIDRTVVRRHGYPSGAWYIEQLLVDGCDGPRRELPEVLVVHDPRTDLVIGLWELRAAAAPGAVTAGGWLADGFRDRGYGTEVLAGVLALAHDHYGFTYVQAVTAVDDLPARYLHEGFDFREVTTAPHVLPDRTVVDAVFYLHTDASARPRCRLLQPPSAPTAPTTA